MVSGALGSAVFSAVTGVLLTRRYPLVVEGVRCCEVAAHLHRRQASIRRRVVHHSKELLLVTFALNRAANFLELRACELRRIDLLRTPVNKGINRAGLSEVGGSVQYRGRGPPASF